MPIGCSDDEMPWEREGEPLHTKYMYVCHAELNAILNSAKQCCAIEGSYPASLEHLESDYGLRVNRDDYVITYEVFAENILPSVVVVPR